MRSPESPLLATGTMPPRVAGSWPTHRRPGRVERWLREAYIDLRIVARNTPWIFRAMAPLQSDPDRRAVTRRSDIVIEGAPRSANTFAVEAFRHAQPRPVRMAHHFHAAGQLLLAERWGVPAIVLIRCPEDTVASQLVYAPMATPEACLREYTSFYSCLLSRRHAFVIARFDEVTADFGGVIERVNAKFGTAFVPFDTSPANRRTVFALVRAAGGARGARHAAPGSSALRATAAAGRHPRQSARATLAWRAPSSQRRMGCLRCSSR